MTGDKIRELSRAAHDSLCFYSTEFFTEDLCKDRFFEAEWRACSNG